jgi:Fe-S-cluster containining protein
MHSSDKFFKPLQKSYETLPGLQCGDCWGECCVSPTLTAVEFIYMMLGLCETQSSIQVAAFLENQVKEHLFYSGNAHCRFQDLESGRCQNYEHRAMACRLHGHEALRAYQTEDLEFCNKKPDHHKNLNTEGLDDRLQLIRDYNQELNIPYEEPWYFCSLNLESWLDFFYTSRLSEQRPVLRQIFNFLYNHLDLPSMEGRYQLTTLEGQLNTIETLYMAIEQGEGVLALDCLDSILNDFPSTGSYYLDEGHQMKAILLKNSVKN